MGFNGDLMGFNGDLMGFNGDLMGFNGDLMGFNGDVMEISSGNLLQFAIEHGPLSSLIYLLILLRMVIFQFAMLVYWRV